MSKQTAPRLFLYTVIAIGAISVASAAIGFTVEDRFKFACYCAVAFAAALLKVCLPGITGTLSVSYVVVLIGLTEQTLAECLFAGLIGALVQCYLRAQTRPRPVQVAFNLANLGLSITCCHVVYVSHYLRTQGIGTLMLLTFSSMTYFVVNAFAVTGIISLTESKPLLRIWKECYLWSFPFFFMGAGIAWIFHRVALSYGWQVAMLGLPVVYVFYHAYRLYLGRLRTETKHAQEMASLHLRTIEALAMAIDAKDQTTHDHLQRVQVYATEIAKDLRLSDLEMQALQAAAMLHDIGKLAVPEHIVSKPGKLTPEEFEKMKIHPGVGAEILEQVRFPYPVAPIVRSHHEKWDGSGYPDGLKGDAIPIGARILAAVDCLDALASNRQYRKAVPVDRAMDMVEAEAGKSFDPAVVAALRKRYQELEGMAHGEPAAIHEPVAHSIPELSDVSPAEIYQPRLPDPERDRISFLTAIAAARQEVQIVLEMSGDLGNTLCLESTLALCAAKMEKMIPHDLFCLFTVGEGILEPRFVRGAEQALFSSLRIPVSLGLSGWVAANNAAVLNGNPAAEPGYLNDATVITNLQSALAIPLEEDGVSVGVLTLYASKKEAFTRDHLRILQTLGPRLSATLIGSRKLNEARDNAVTDYLTGLPNSRSLYLHLDAEVSRSRRNGSPVAVFLCDLDGFKRVNDEHGHLEGNRVLKAIAASLRQCCRIYDYVARMGGDEFVIVLPGVHESELEDHVMRFRTAVELTGVRIGYEGLSVSIGAVIYSEQTNSGDADLILAEADKRMYSNKKRRRIPVAAGLRPNDQPGALSSRSLVCS